MSQHVPSLSLTCVTSGPHVNRSRVVSHLALLSCLNMSEFPLDVPVRLLLWKPHSLCKYVYTLYRVLCTFIEVFAYLDDMPHLMELTTGTCF